MNWSIDLTEIIIFLLTLLAGAITSYVIPWIKSKTNATQQQFIDLVVKTGVQAAEQLYGSGEGQMKKQYVLDYLKSKKISIDDVEVESAVKELFGKE